MGKVISGMMVLTVVAGGVWYFVAGANDANAKKTSELAEYYGDITLPTGNIESTQTASVAGTGQLEGTTMFNTQSNQENIMQAVLHTNMGDITIEFDAGAPNTVANFKQLASEGFYNGTKFHRVIDGFMIQGGDPLSKDDAQMPRWGTGGPGYQFADEIHENNHNNTGTIAMANSGPNTNGSQFFINVADNNFLDTKHTVFGRVTSGMDAVFGISKVETGSNDRPVEPVIIESIDLK